MVQIRSGRRAWIAAIVLAVTILFVVPEGFRLWMGRRMTPAQKREMQAYLGTTYNLPPDWLRVESFAAETTATICALLDAAWGVSTSDLDEIAETWKVLNADPAREDARASATGLLARHSAIVNLGRELSLRPDYEASVFERFAGGSPSLHALRLVTRFQSLAAHRAAGAAETTASLEHALAALRLATRDEMASTMISAIAQTIVNEVLDAIIALVRTAVSAPWLRDLAAGMDSLEPRLRMTPRTDMPLALIDAVGTLRAVKREGYPVKIPARGRPYEYAELATSALLGYPAWMLPRIAPDDPALADLQAQEQEYKTSGVSASSNRTIGLLPPPWRKLVRQLLGQIGAHSNDDFRERGHRLAARYSLARVAVAARIMELEEGRRADRVANLVPKYLPTEPLDPFTSQPFLVKRPPGDFYSAGPNGTDDGADPEKDVTLDSPYRAAPTPATNTAPAAAAP